MRSLSDAFPSTTVRRAVALVLALSAASAQLTHSAYAEDAPASDDVANLSDMDVSADAFRALSTEPSGSSFGFAKPLLETPRSVTFVSEEQLRLYGVSTVEDLSRLVPGTYTTTRYGLQGGISVRGVAADFYYRGMKRLQMQGHVRTVLSAYDNIEVIKGPPSALYGMGKIGGYANLEPKSNRARTGKYMTKEQGYFQATVGSYQKNEMQFGLGVPYSVFGKTSGAYIVALLEDSGTYVKTVDAHQKFIQATNSVDNAIGPFRLETGGQMQNSVTSGAYFTRVTQDLIDNGNYIQGKPLANLDLNGDGRIGFVETVFGSPIEGKLTSSNQPLDQRYAVTVNSKSDVAGWKNTINGIPSTMKAYLDAHPEINCSMANYMRSSAVTSVDGTLSATLTGNRITRTLPVGFVLDPCTVGTKKLTDADYRSNGAFEREQNATQRMGYFDLIYDTDPNFTVKNQFFYDSISSFKDSWLPYGEKQAIHTFEDKITATKKMPAEWLPDWMDVNTLGSINYRTTAGYITSSGGDFDYRQDITSTTGAGGSGTGGFYPNTMFWTQLTNNSYQTGVPNTTNRRSTYSESGAGLMLDINFIRDLNLVMGARYDKVDAKARELAAFSQTSSYTMPTGTALSDLIAGYIAGTACTEPGNGCPGSWLSPGTEYKSSESGASYNASLSYQLPWGGMRPYLTWASSAIILDSSNNLFTGSQVQQELLVGKASLKEMGIKGQLFRNRLQWTLSAFEQERTDVSGGSDPTINAFATSTNTKGIEASVNYQATKKLFVGASLTTLDARYVAGAVAQTFDVDTRDLGWSDITDPNTGLVYSAEAFGYGGRTRITLTDVNNLYDKVPGNPDVQAAINATYTLGKGFGLLGNVQYTSDSWANRLQTETIPASTILNVGATWDSARIHVKANIYNVTDEITFRAGNGGVSSMVSVLPDRRYEAQLKIDF